MPAKIKSTGAIVFAIITISYEFWVWVMLPMTPHQVDSQTMLWLHHPYARPIGVVLAAAFFLSMALIWFPDVLLKPLRRVPLIAGDWEDEDHRLVRITRTGRDWMAECEYMTPKNVHIRWVIEGTIKPNGEVEGKLTHLLAPADWKRTQTRKGKVLPSGQIGGVADFEGGNHAFLWTRVENEAAQP